MTNKKKTDADGLQEPVADVTEMSDEQFKELQKQQREERSRAKKERKAAEKEAKKEEARQARQEARERMRNDNILESLGRLGYGYDGSGEYDDHGYEYDESGRFVDSIKNVKNLLMEHPDFAGKFARNMFSNAKEYCGMPIDDFTIGKLYEVIQDKLGFLNKFNTDNAIINACDANQYHPILDVVDKLEWDGVPRVETFFVDRLGAPNTPLTREMTFKWLFAMYSRIKEPGCYFDHYLIISDSRQGTGKSKTFERITSWLGRGYTATNLTTDTADKDNIMYINGCVIGLFDETDQLKYSKLESFKKFVTNGQMTVRLPYAKNIGTYLVHSVYCATTNDSKFLTDSTSSYERRAWVLLCEGNPGRTIEEWEALNNTDVMKQVWAELVYYYKEENRKKAPWDIVGGKVTSLCDENIKALMEVQLGVKTSNDDTAAINAIETILNQKYSKDTSDGRTSGGFAGFETEKEFSEDHRFKYNPEEFKYPLEKIPLRWFCGYVNRELGAKGNRSLEYLSGLIEGGSITSIVGEWKIGWKSYDGVKQKCIYRVHGTEPASGPGVCPVAEPNPSEPTRRVTVGPTPVESLSPSDAQAYADLMRQAELAIAMDAEYSPMWRKIRQIQRGELVIPLREPADRPADAPAKPVDRCFDWKMEDVGDDELERLLECGKYAPKGQGARATAAKAASVQKPKKPRDPNDPRFNWSCDDITDEEWKELLG